MKKTQTIEIKADGSLRVTGEFSEFELESILSQAAKHRPTPRKPARAIAPSLTKQDGFVLFLFVWALGAWCVALSIISNPFPTEQNETHKADFDRDIPAANAPYIRRRNLADRGNSALD